MAQTIASVDPGNTLDDTTQAHGMRTLFRKISDPLKSLLLLRYTLLNVLAFSLLAVAYKQGYVERVIEADQTFLLSFLLYSWSALDCARTGSGRPTAKLMRSTVKRVSTPQRFLTSSLQSVVIKQNRVQTSVAPCACASHIGSRLFDTWETHSYCLGSLERYSDLSSPYLVLIPRKHLM